MKSLILCLSILVSSVAMADVFTYSCEPTMSNPDRVPWILKVDGEQIALGQSLENMKTANQVKNYHLGWLTHYVRYSGSVSELFTDPYVAIYVKPELKQGGSLQADGGIGGWMVISRGAASRGFYEPMFMCKAL